MAFCNLLKWASLNSSSPGSQPCSWERQNDSPHLNQSGDGGKLLKSPKCGNNCSRLNPSVFLKPGEGTPLLAVVKWVWDREVTWERGTSSCQQPFPAAYTGATCTPVHKHLAEPVAQKGGSGLKTWKVTFSQTKNIQFQQLMFWIVILKETATNPVTTWNCWSYWEKACVVL